MKKIFAAILAALMLLSLACIAMAEPALPEGASFTKVENVGGIEGSSFYLYVASELYAPHPMLTSVIYVYGDKPYADVDAAWAAMEAAGLNAIAEEEHGAVIMVNPVGETWGKDDIDVYEAIMEYIYFTDGDVSLTYHNLQYAIGEGSGATFINNYLAQNCKRLAGVMTFGGEIGTPRASYALPAYIVSGSQAAVDYFISNNDGTPFIPDGGRKNTIAEMIKANWTLSEDDAKTVYTYAPDPVKKVIVSKAEATALDADLILDCWKTLFRLTTRTCLTTNCWAYGKTLYNDHEFTLMARPDYEAAGMDVIKIEGVGNGIYEDNESNYWYEFVPKAVQEAMANGTDETFPLFVCLHGGGDHPVYEAESVGWAQLAIDHDIIIVAPNPSSRTPEHANTQPTMELIKLMCEKYPVDQTRIYAGGFSGGARSTLALSNYAPEVFAAVAPMSCVSGPYYSPLMEKIDTYTYDIDLPILFAGQALEAESTNWNYEYIWYDAVQIMWKLNEIAPYEGELDYSKYPYWGFPTEDELRFAQPSGFALWRAFQYDEEGVPLLGMMHSEGTTHTHYPEYADLIWEWMSQFSRDLETKDVIYTPAK